MREEDARFKEISESCSVKRYERVSFAFIFLVDRLIKIVKREELADRVFGLIS